MLLSPSTKHNLIEYKHKLKFEPSANTNKEKKRIRYRIYFNPPYSINVKTNIGAKFLRHTFSSRIAIAPTVKQKESETFLSVHAKFQGSHFKTQFHNFKPENDTSTSKV